MKKVIVLLLLLLITGTISGQRVNVHRGGVALGNVPTAVSGDDFLTINRTTGRVRAYTLGEMQTLFSSSGVSSGLELITENGNTGYRFTGENPANHGDIGMNAIDLTINGANAPPSSIAGALGFESFAVGNGAFAQGDRSYAIGNSADAISANGITIGNFAYSEGLNTLALGVSADATGDLSIAIGNNSNASSDQSIAIGNNAQSRSAGTIAIGDFTEITFSRSNAIAIGTRAKAQRQGSIAFGANADATGFEAFALLDGVAQGDHSRSIAHQSTAYSFYETVVGGFSTDYTPISTFGFNPNDRVFTIGNGSSNTVRNDALIVKKNGVLTAPSLDISEIIDPKSLITKEYGDTNYATITSGVVNDITLTDFGGNGTYTIVGTNQTIWTKIGRTVHITIVLRSVQLTGSATGEFRIGNLPFPATNFSSLNMVRWNGSGTDYNTITPTVIGTDIRMSIIESTGNYASSITFPAAPGASGVIILSGTYITN